jgi:acetyl esterase/lipase
MSEVSRASEAPQQNVDRLNELEQQLKPHLGKPKSEWPLEVMAEIHGVAKEITKVVGQKLYKAMEFPTDKFSDPELFYDKNFNKDFARIKTKWLGTQGYRMHKTTYTYTNTWDRVPITAAFYIPDNLQPRDKSQIIWYFHGGGYVSDVHYGRIEN